jgi:translation initiation factor IF-3
LSLWESNLTDREHRINHEIRTPQVHLILEDGESRGTVPTQEALRLAREAGLDLVEIAPKAIPPVAKLLDYNKFRYEQEKKARQSIKNTRNPQLKEVRLSFRIGTHDMETKAKRAREFMDEGHFIRAVIVLRGRENVFPDKAKERLEEFRSVTDSVIEQPVTHIGNRVQVILKAKK